MGVAEGDQTTAALMVMQPQEMSLADVAVLMQHQTRMMGQMQQFMQSAAVSMQATNERVARLEKNFDLMAILTTPQMTQLKQAIRARAANVAEEWGLPAAFAQNIAAAIRKEIKATGGVRSLQELPRCEYQVYMEQVKMWDDFHTINQLKEKARGVGHAAP